MTTRVEFDKMRNEAFEKLKTEREQFSLVEQGSIQEIIEDFIFSNKSQSGSVLSIQHQIYRDVRISGYKKYDCLAMWLDSENGLAKYEPELIKKIAIEVGGLTEVKI